MAVGPSPWFRGFPRNILKLKRELGEMQEWRDSYVVMEMGDRSQELSPLPSRFG